MKKVTILLISLWLLPFATFSQIDETRMTKDLRVAAKVLETLWQGEDNFVMYDNNVEGNYIEGYGVIFSIGGQYSVFYTPKIAYSYRNEGVAVQSRARVQVSPDTPDSAIDIFTKDYNDKIEKVDLEEVMIEFLVNYSQMIGQLKPTDKIVISTKKSDYVYVVFRGGNDEQINPGARGITAEMLIKDHIDYVSGKINREQLTKRITVNKSNGEAMRAKDLDLFGSMLKTVYDENYTNSYFMTWRPDYQRLKGVGVIYTFKVYSTYDDSGLYRMPATKESGLSARQRNEKVEQLYPLFLQSMKENLIQYGRTINSLEKDELVILKITLTKCNDCSIPKKIQLSVKQSVLADFNTGKLSEKDAIARVKISEL
jgi:hypothetical protein